MNENKSHETNEEKRAERHARVAEVKAEVKAEAKKLVESAPSLDQIAKVARSVGEDVAEYVKQRPVAAIGIAAGAGFALGSVFGTKLGRMALTVAAGYAVQEIIDGALGEDGVKKLVTNEINRLINQRGGAS